MTDVWKNKRVAFSEHGVDATGGGGGCRETLFDTLARWPRQRLTTVVSVCVCVCARARGKCRVVMPTEEATQPRLLICSHKLHAQTSLADCRTWQSPRRNAGTFVPPAFLPPIPKKSSLRKYKSLFTENSVATQKRYSTSINTNKIQNTTIKSITSSFFTKLKYLLHLITYVLPNLKC